MVCWPRLSYLQLHAAQQADKIVMHLSQMHSACGKATGDSAMSASLLSGFLSNARWQGDCWEAVGGRELIARFSPWEQQIATQGLSPSRLLASGSKPLQMWLPLLGRCATGSASASTPSSHQQIVSLLLRGRIPEHQCSQVECKQLVMATIDQGQIAKPLMQF